MEVKRYRAASMAEAMQAVKEDLGDEAVILKSEVLPRNGVFDIMKKDVFEVIAAVDMSVEELAKWTPKRASNAMHPPRAKASPNHGSAVDPAGNYSAPYFRAKRPDKPSEPPEIRKWEPDTHFSTRPTGDGGIALDPVRQAMEIVNDELLPVASTVEKCGSQSGPSQDGRTERMRRFKEHHGEKIDTLMREVNGLSAMVQSMNTRLDTAPDPAMEAFVDLPATYANEMTALVERGVEKSIAQDVIRQAVLAMPADRDDSNLLRANVIEALAERIHVAGPIRYKRGRPKVIAMVGQTGVGKTTTLTKLATNGKFMYNKRVSLITADTYRVSAIEHLNTFAGIAHLPISAVYSPAELRAVLDAQQDKELVFIDTAGRSPKDDKHLYELKNFLELASPDEVHLVLPANMKNEDMLESIRRFGVLPLDSIIFTKIDEAKHLGSIVNISHEVSYPISYVSSGQTIPDDIELANPLKLARLIMRVA